MTLFNGLGDGLLARPLLKTLVGHGNQVDLYCLAAEAETIYGGLGLHIYTRTQDDLSAPAGRRPSLWLSLNAYAPVPMEAPFEAVWSGLLRRGFHELIRARLDTAWQSLPMRDQYYLAAGLPGKSRPSDSPPTLPRHADLAAQAWLGLLRATRLCVLHGDSLAEKRWPVRFWSLLAGHLRQFGFSLVACGKERDLWATIPDVYVAWPYLDLPAQLAVLRRAELFVGIDSLFMHVADAFERPGVVLWGPTEPSVWGPFFPRLRPVISPDGSMASLSVDHVLTSVEELLERKSGPSPAEDPGAT